VSSLIDCSLLPEECNQLYKEHVKDGVQALSYSFSNLRRKEQAGKIVKKTDPPRELER
jgi:hypothetical protein